MSSTTEPNITTNESPWRVFGPLIPGLILVAMVGFILTTRWNYAPTPVEQLRQILDTTNSTARGQALLAFQKRLSEDQTVAIDVEIALELLTRTDRLLQESTPREAKLESDLLQLSPHDAELATNRLLGDRDYLQELLATLPCSLVPVGLPLLCELVDAKPAIDRVALAYRRRDGLRALATLGEGMQRWKHLSPQGKEYLVTALNRPPVSGQVGTGIVTARAHLKSLAAEKPDLLGLEKTLIRCAADEDPVLREGAALAARWWIGTTEQNEALEAMLVRLLTDDGRNENLRVELLSERIREAQKSLPRIIEGKPGFVIQTQAVLALASRASPRLSLDRLTQLLDLDHLKAMLLVELPDGKRGVNEARVVELLLTALQVVAQLHEKEPKRDLSTLMPAIKKLKEHSSAVVRVSAERVLIRLEEKAKP